MSHDQRPARMRVVADAASRGNAVDTSEMQNGQADEAKVAADGLPIVPAMIFIIACIIGGAVVTYLMAGAH
ncbi:hypothetical protein SAMN03159338_3556 [Sphingomonas sp. NFR04]|uniref:hypothetical protein n=1 Tax=Sphingomonas sp. NFR04 TaxID=1566283 RepID=UPI0008EB4BFB|nr:hypothetical protein [Sphingomonas sp. NFR04]SFK18915.1 hypothetical protein SAMN03159338_3556 [Sphingomonas sp. NFR04]